MVAVAFFWSSQSHAQSAPSNVYGSFFTSGGVEVLTGADIGGGMTANQARGQMIWNRGFAPVEGAMPTVSGTATVPNPIGNPVAIASEARLTPLGTARAVGRLASKLVTPIVYGMALYDFAKELGFLPVTKADGTQGWQKRDGNACTTAPCYLYGGENDPSPNGLIYSRDEACTREASQKSFNRGGGFVWTSLGGNTGAGNMVYCPMRITFPDGSTANDGLSLNFREVPVSSPDQIPMVSADQQQFEDAIAAKSGWPTSSTLYRVLKDATDALERTGGQPIATGPATVSGPATSRGPTTSSNDGTNTTNNTTTYNHTYQGATVSTSAVTVTTVTNNSTGAVTTTTTNNSSPRSEPAPLGNASDTPLGDVPKLYKQQYPRGLEGVWDTQKAALTSTPLATLANRLMPSVGSGGSCPVMMVNLTFASWANYGTHDVAPPCFIWDFCRAIILISALLLCRRLIFGG